MSIAQYSGQAPEALAQPLSEQPDPRGPRYGTLLQPDGDELRVLWLKLDSAQLFRRGKEDNVIRYRLYFDLNPDGSAPLHEATHYLRLPFEDGDLNVTNVVPYPTEGIGVAEVERTI